MPFYLTQAKLSKDAIQAMMAEPRDRTGPVGKLLEAVSGKQVRSSAYSGRARPNVRSEPHFGRAEGRL